MNVLFDCGPWQDSKDGDPSAYAIYQRHYSFYRYADGRRENKEYRNRRLFVGPGEKLVLITAAEDALFVWRKFIDDCIDERTGQRQQGVNCAAFRNESTATASDLILAAEEIAWRKWPGERLYTYVNPCEVPPTMVRGHPVWGWCFYKAGWKFCGLTKRGLHVMEKTP